MSHVTGAPARPPRAGFAAARSVARTVSCAVLGLGLTACGGGRDFVDKRLDTLDAAYQQRSSPEQLDDAVRGYLQLNERFEGDVRVLSRLARAYTVRAELGQGDDRLRDYSTAKEFGLECLMQRGSFAGLVIANGGMVVPAAARELEPEDVGCIVWTVIPWARWVHERGAGGVGLDHEVLIALSRRAVELNERWGRGRSQYALGLALSLPPDVLEPKLGKAGAAFEGAMSIAPDRLSVQVDYALHVLERTGATEKAEALLRKVAETGLADDQSDRAENEAAINLAREILGMPPLTEQPAQAEGESTAPAGEAPASAGSGEPSGEP